MLQTDVDRTIECQRDTHQNSIESSWSRVIANKKHEGESVIDGHTDRQTDRLTDRTTDKQTDRRTGDTTSRVAI